MGRRLNNAASDILTKKFHTHTEHLLNHSINDIVHSWRRGRGSFEQRLCSPRRGISCQNILAAKSSGSGWAGKSGPKETIKSTFQFELVFKWEAKWKAPSGSCVPCACQGQGCRWDVPGGERASPDVFDLQRAINEFKGYKRVAEAGGGAGHGWLLIHAQVSPCCGGGSGCLQAEGEYQGSLAWLGWKAAGLVSIPKLLKLRGPSSQEGHRSE